MRQDRPKKKILHFMYLSIEFCMNGANAVVCQKEKQALSSFSFLQLFIIHPPQRKANGTIFIFFQYHIYLPVIHKVFDGKMYTYIVYY